MSTLNSDRIKEKEKKRKRTILKISIVEIFVAIWIVSILQQCIEIVFTGNYREINVSYVYAIKQMIGEKINQLLFNLAEALYALFMILPPRIR